MKVFQIGLGSMGKRRIRNLRALGELNIIAYDPREDRREEVWRLFGIRAVNSFEEGLAYKPDVLIISTPPNEHYQYEMAAAQIGLHFFCEASVIDEGMDTLITQCKRAGIVAAPSCTLRFHPSVRALKRIVSEGVIGTVSCFTYHSGQYLPDWHPWEDYRSYYVAEPVTGACREIVPFELTWLTWVLGSVTELSCQKGKLTNLDVAIDDVYQLLLRFASGTLGHLLVDVISRKPIRRFFMISEEGTAVWDWSSQMVRVYTASDGKWQEIAEGHGFQGSALESMYIDELAHFLSAVRGEAQYMYSLEEDRGMLGLLAAAEASAAQRKHITLS